MKGSRRIVPTVLRDNSERHCFRPIGTDHPVNNSPGRIPQGLSYFVESQHMCYGTMCNDSLFNPSDRTQGRRGRPATGVAFRGNSENLEEHGQSARAPTTASSTNSIPSVKLHRLPYLLRLSTGYQYTCCFHQPLLLLPIIYGSLTAGTEGICTDQMGRLVLPLCRQRFHIPQRAQHVLYDTVQYRIGARVACSIRPCRGGRRSPLCLVKPRKGGTTPGRANASQGFPVGQTQQETRRAGVMNTLPACLHLDTRWHALMPYRVTTLPHQRTSGLNQAVPHARHHESNVSAHRLPDAGP